MNTSKLKSASESDHPQDQGTDQEIQRAKLEWEVRTLTAELERQKQEDIDLKQKYMNLEWAATYLFKYKEKLDRELQRVSDENIHLKENYLKISILQQILIMLSNAIIAIGVALILTTNVGLIVILMGIGVYVAQLFPTFWDLLKYLKARKGNP